MLRLRKFDVPVAAADGAPPARRLLAMLATVGGEHEEGDGQLQRYDEALVYLHGFPDMSVHPTRLSFASRLPVKLGTAWLQAQAELKQQKHARRVFVSFNFGGIPGSDGEFAFVDKTVGQEVEDAIAVCKYVRTHVLMEGSDASRLHVVGLSTGAIIASLLRSVPKLCDSITAIAGLLDVAAGVQFDFTAEQLAQFEANGWCWKEFYLPEECPLPRNAAISLDGQVAEDEEPELPPEKIFLQLDERYVAECRDGSLNVRAAVSDSNRPPMLIVHGDADRNVPVAQGEALFEAAAEPKTWLLLHGANHLLSNSKHLKKALRAIELHTAAV